MANSTSKSAPLHLVVVTPEKTTLDVQAEFVAVPLYDGELGIARNHAPLIGRLGFGELRYTAGGEQYRYYVDAGFVQVQGNEVSVLTNHALPAADLDPRETEEQLHLALSRASANPEEMAIRDRAVSQARARLRIAGK